MSLILPSALTCGSPALASAACPPLTMAGLGDLSKGMGGAVKLVFFSSWCSSCLPHLTTDHDDKTLLIGSFDEPERIEAVISALKPDAPCYFDKGITDALDVSSLPKVLTWSPPSS